MTIVSAQPEAQKGNAAMYWSMAYKVSDALMLLTNGGALARLAAQPQTAPALADRLGWQADPLATVLDVLVRAGVLERQDDTYQVPAATAAVLPLIVMESQVRQWHAANQSLEKMVQQGVAADPLSQIPGASYLDNYQAAMAASARALALHLFRHGGLAKARKVVDIGGADGAVSVQLGQLMPVAAFAVVDRPPVAAHFQRRMATLAQPERFRFVADDVTRPDALLAVAADADAVIISNLLHLLGARHIRALLLALKEVLPSGCRVLVYDQFIDPAQFDAASMMVIDWVNLGSLFDLCDGDMVALLDTLGYADAAARRFPLLPGALVGATIP